MKVLLIRGCALVLGLAAAGLAERGAAEVSLPNIFGDHMVLQQQQPNKVWGKAEPGEAVSVAIADQQLETVADEQGNWSVMLAPLEIGEPLVLLVKGTNAIRVEDVLVGEVWICSGQSNMEWPMAATFDYDLERQAAEIPSIRMINYPNVASQEPIWTHENAHWQVSNSENLGSFSAVGYFFGRQLQQTLGVPIGLINNSWGGSACDAWIAREHFAGHELLEPIVERTDGILKEYQELVASSELSDEQEKRKKELERHVRGNHLAANLYNGILKSHLGYGIRGAIWYQGESNAGRAFQYRELFPLMIQTWRDEWGEGEFPFYWVQLADFKAEKSEPSESGWAELREAQTMTLDKLPNTGEAVIVDIGEGNDIHPRNKRDVGLRLARWALAKDYGVDMPHRSPRYESMTVDGGKATLKFAHVDGGGWRPFDTKRPRGFAIAGEDKRFVWADAKILDDGAIEVWSDEVAEPVAVRYGWADNPVCNMYDRAGLPLTPFRTDDWPGVTYEAR